MFIESLKKMPKEADTLLDLHDKYKQRIISAMDFSRDTSSSIRKLIIDEEVAIKKHDGNENNNSNIIFTSDINYPPDRKAEAKLCQRHSSYIDSNDFFKMNFKNNYCKSKMFDVNDDLNINYNNYIKQITREVPCQVEREIHKLVNNLVSPYAVNLNTNPFSLEKSVHVTSESFPRREPQNYTNRNKYFKTTPLFDFNKKVRILPQDMHKKQMEYIVQKEQEIQLEIEMLEQEKKCLEIKCPLIKSSSKTSLQSEVSRMKTIPLILSENFRNEMYNEWLGKLAEREERKQRKILKMATKLASSENFSSELKYVAKPASRIEDEFMTIVRKKNKKQNGEELSLTSLNYDEPEKLPKHLQEFVEYLESVTKENGELHVVIVA